MWLVTQQTLSGRAESYLPQGDTTKKLQISYLVYLKVTPMPTHTSNFIRILWQAATQNHLKFLGAVIFITWVFIATQI